MATKYADKTKADVLERALGLMNDSGAHWIQGDYTQKLEDGSWAFCSVGAILQAATAYPTDLIVTQVCEELEKELPPAEDGYKGRDRVVEFNDADTTNWDDVVNVFRRTVARLRGE